jgi:hypothetical protein
VTKSHELQEYEQIEGEPNHLPLRKDQEEVKRCLLQGQSADFAMGDDLTRSLV